MLGRNIISNLNLKFELFDEWLDGVLITDPQKKYVYANNAFFILFQTNQRKLKKLASLEEFASFSNKIIYLNEGSNFSENNTNSQIESGFETKDGVQGTVLIITKKIDENNIITFFKDMA